MESPENLASIELVAMEAAAIVVGEYYMVEINKQLDSINDTLNDVKEFQMRELKAMIRSLLISVSQLSKFSTEYLLDEELCRLKLMELSHHRSDLLKSLEQVNLAISDIISQNKDIPFEKYEKRTLELENYLFYQKNC